MRKVACAVVAVIALFCADPVQAHGGEGVLTVTSTEPTGSTSVRYQVQVVFADDGHAATGATVTASAESAEGGMLGPVQLDPVEGSDGMYAGVVDFPSPGSWAVRFTSLSPPASIEVSPQMIAAPTTTTVPPTTTTEPKSLVVEKASTSSSPTVLWVVLVLAVVIVLGTAVVIWRHLRR